MSYQTAYGASIYLTFAGKPLILTGALSDQETNFEVDMPTFTLGELINGIIHMVKPSYTLNFDAPWSYILNAEIKNFKLKLKVPAKSSGKPIEFGIQYDTDIQIPGFEITSLCIMARSIRDVNFNMTGSLEFLGITYKLDELFGKDGVNLLDPQGMPQPTPKPSVFKLNFLGAGQHLELADASQYNHVHEVVDRLQELMQEPPPGTVVPAFTEALHFNNNSQWLFAIDAVIMDTVAFKIVFNDPVLYGLYLSLSGEKAKVFDGLEFEILYKKITDDIGVYQLELKLPDSIRSLEFGAVSITLPVIGIWIYTNGNFKIDLGFPYNNDFSRSFHVQAFPFTGAGGFYFAVLNGSTSLTVPKTDLGTFSPVLEFGIGLNLGLGKSFNKGILSAGLTLVFYGIVEGTLGWFKPHSPDTVNSSGTDLYYKLKGTFGIVGHIFGSVNFAIISATLDIIVYAQATVTIEAAEPILLAFEAGVSIQLTVKINLGFFSIKIHLSFSATIREQFTIGSSSPAQWKPITAPESLYRLNLNETTPIALNWDSLVTVETPQQLDLYFIPFFSVSKPEQVQSTVGIASLFAENDHNTPITTYVIDEHSLHADNDLKAFDKLCISILSWVFNASLSERQQNTSFSDVLTDQISAAQINQILNTLNQTVSASSSAPLFSYKQLINFIKELFVLDITAAQGTQEQTLSLTVFPMIPDLLMSDSVSDRVVNFSTFNTVNDQYLAQVSALVSQFTDSDPTNIKSVQSEMIESMATLVFTDYFQLLVKSLLQSAQDNLEVYNYILPSHSENTLSAVASAFNVSAASVVLANKAVPGILIPGKNMVIPGMEYALSATDTFDRLQQSYSYVNTGTNWNLDFIHNNLNTMMFKTGASMEINGHDYIILPNDTFDSIKNSHSLTLDELADVMDRNKTKLILETFSLVTLPYFTVTIDSDSTFLSLATTYSMELDVMAEANLEQNILQSGASFFITHVQSLSVQTILNAVYQSNGFSKAGGSASRFALHGLRLPEVIDGHPGSALNGLYELTGQQLQMQVINDPTAFSYSLTLSKPTDPEIPLSWLSFTGKGSDANSIHYTLMQQEIDRIYAFQTIGFAPKIDQGPSAIQLYKDQNRVFACTNPISWSAFGRTPMPSIWNLPSSLTGIGSRTPIVDLKLAVQTRPDAARDVYALPADKYFYGTLVPITIKKVSNQAQEKINERTFEVFGTDASGIETLTALLRADHIDTLLDTVSILYASNPDQDQARALRSDDVSKLLLLLINTNLSTETNPDTQRLSALTESNKISNTAAIDVVSRLWKSSLVRTGGYYLYYDLDGDTLPESLFDKNGNGEIYLLIQYKNLPTNQITAYMNMAGLYQTVDTAQSLLFAEWRADLQTATPAQLNQMLIENQIIRNAVIKPGNVGFELDRENPDEVFNVEKDNSDNYAYDLQIQYNLLNYAIQGDGKYFETLQSVTPVSPAKDPNHTTNGWHYSKAMPIRKFYKGQNTSAYIGLGESVTIGFNWQDNYGNIVNSPLNQVNYKILYFDQLIPFSTWPSLTTDYYFFKEVANDHPDVNFELTFHFIPGAKYSFNPTDPDVQNLKAALVAQAKESLKMYAGILDQVMQNDVSINLKISTNPDALYPLAPDQQELKNGVMKLIQDTTDWIQTFIADPDGNNQYQTDDNPYPEMASYPFRCLIDPVNPQDIFALAVNLLISRSTDLIDPQFVFDNHGTAMYAPGVQQVISSVKPKTSGFPATSSLNTDDKSLALRNFALHFEQAFGERQFKLAATYVGKKNNTLTQTNNEELWVVRIKNTHDQSEGIACSVQYDQAYYYSPQPLANFLFGLQNIEIHDFDFYTGSQSGSSQRNFSGIDSEVWAQNFLQSVETILGSDMSLPITMIDHLNGTTDDNGILAHLLQAKQTVADAIGLQTIPILLHPDQQESGLALATEKIRQQLLINLYNGYMINTLVQYRVEVDTPYPNAAQQIAPNYYGKPFVHNQVADDAKSYSFSTAKIPLKNLASDPGTKESYLTYTFEAKTPSLSARISVPVQYNITHAEFNIQKLKENANNLPEDLNNYEVSEWLNFIIPFDVAYTTMADTEIPVPLRQYPALPVFGSQIFNPKVENTAKDKITIEDAKLSNFSFDYTLDHFVAQDGYHFEVYFNADPEKIVDLQDSKSLSAKQKALFAQLAQFENVSKDFTDYFKTKLPHVSQDMSADERQTLTQMLSAYSDLVNQVGDAWLNLYTKDLKANLMTMLEVITATFEVTESSSDMDPDKGLFQIAISNWSVVSADKTISYVYFPEVSIQDWTSECYDYSKINDMDPLPIPQGQDPAQYEQVILRYYRIIDGQKEYLSFTEGVQIRSRKITFKDLSVLLIQNAWAGLWIERNATLGPYPTAPEFIYTTPLSRFNNPIMPSLKLNNTFKLQPPAPDQRKLKHYICSLLSKLLLAPDQSSASASLKILVHYKFTTSGQLGDMPYIQLPILLMPPTLFTKADVDGDGEAVNALNQTILSWFTDTQPIFNCGIITFSAFFYSNLTGTTNSLPLLVLDNLEIDIQNISDIKQQ